MSDEWFTPLPIIEAARAAMGSIDLDPASCSEAQKTVKARVFYTKDDDGLLLPWFGNVWCNPPYSRALKAKFMARASIEKLRVDQLCLLINADTCRSLECIAEDCQAMCLINGRVRFMESVDRAAKHANRWGSVIYYFGERISAFRRAFKPLGTITIGVGPYMDADTRKAMRRYVRRNCLTCGAEMLPERTGRLRMTCSVRCRVARHRRNETASSNHVSLHVDQPV